MTEGGGRENMERPEKPRQVILIMTDTTRKDMLGCYGDSKMVTPNLDRLAEEGIRYDKAYTVQPLCGPARSAIFTGLSPHANGVHSNGVAMGDNVKTIGQRLGSHHIHCGYIGKWHLDGGDYFGTGQCPDGWDPGYWYDMAAYLEELSDQDKVRSRDYKTSFDSDINETFTYAHRCSDRALEFLKENQNTEYFLTVSYDEPHGPCICPAPYNTMYRGGVRENRPEYGDDLSDKPMLQRLWAREVLAMDSKEIRELLGDEYYSLYLGCNSYVDYEIGRVLDAVRTYAPDALIIYTSDHGDMLGEHKLFSKNAACYEGVTNIPLIIKGGEKGKVVTGLASHIDLAPTLLDYFGLPVSPQLEGKSMLNQIYDTSIELHDAVFTEFTRYQVAHDGFGGLQLMRAVITKRYKLCINLCDIDELYDLEQDPHEMKNLILNPAYKEVRNELHDVLLQHMNDSRDPMRGYQWEVRYWRDDRVPRWENDGMTRQRINDEDEPLERDYDTGLFPEEFVRFKAE